MHLFLCPDEDDEGERNNVPFTPLSSFFTDDDSLKQQKKKKPKKMKEGKISKVKKRKKEVRPHPYSAFQPVMTSHTAAVQEICLICTLHSFSLHQPFDVFAIGSKVCFGNRTASVI